MADLTVVSANLHNDHAAVDYLRRRSRRDALEHFDVALVSEAHRRRRELARAPGHDYLTGSTRGPSQEVGILLGRHLDNLGHGYEFLSPELPRFESVGKERWGHDVVTEIRGVPTAVIAYHPVAGPTALHGDNPDHPLVERYAMATRWLDAKVDYHEARGREVIVGSDCQMRERAGQLWSPRHVFANHDMDWLWVGIDVIAWTRGYALVGNRNARVRDIGSDHPALRAELNINRTRRRTP